MSRRPSLPGAAELFRVTGGPSSVPGPAPAPESPGARTATTSPIREVPPQPEPPEPPLIIRPAPQVEPPFDDEAPADFAAPPRRQAGTRRRISAVGERRPSGRQRHEEKITVYCSAEELVDLEHARLALRADH